MSFLNFASRLQEKDMVTPSLPLPVISPPTGASKWCTEQQILGVVLICTAIGSLTLLAHGGDQRAWYAAAENVSRFSALVFLGFFVSGSLSYFFRAPRCVGTAEQTLLLAFVGSYFVYLGFIVARVLLTDTRTPTETLSFCAFAAIAPSVLAASTYRRRERPPNGGWEILRCAAIMYFWLILALGGLGHFYGPHRQDRYFGLLLVLLAGAFLMRLFAASGRRFATPVLAPRRAPP
jgi:hypothetical protein